MAQITLTSPWTGYPCAMLTAHQGIRLVRALALLTAGALALSRTI